MQAFSKSNTKNNNNVDRDHQDNGGNDQPDKGRKWSGVRWEKQEFQIAHKIQAAQRKKSGKPKIFRTEEDAICSDCGSTFSSAKECDLLAGVREADVKIAMHANSGDKMLDEEGDMLGFEEKAHCDPGGKVDMFGFCNAPDQHQIACDDQIEDAFVAHTDKGKANFGRNHEGSHG